MSILFVVYPCILLYYTEQGLIDMQDYYTPQEVSEKLKIDIRTIYRWIREDRLKAVKVGHVWRISEAELKRILGENGQ